MKKYYTLEEAKQRFLGNAKLSYRKTTIGVGNINYVCHYLGKDWIERIFRSSSGVVIFYMLSNMGNQLKYMKRMRRYRILLKRIKLIQTTRDLNPFLTELSMVSKFVKYNIPLYYEPGLIVNKKRRVPDFKIKVNNNWVYFEVCAPDNIMWAPLQKIAKELLNSIKNKVDKQYSLFILLTRLPSKEEMEILKSKSIETIRLFKNGTSSIDLDEYAKVVIDDSDPQQVARFIKIKKGYLTVNLCSIIRNKGNYQKINLQMIFADKRAENILKREARQLSKKTRNLIVFSMGSLGKSIAKWKSIISRRLKGKINRRINGVFLLDAAMSGKTGKTIRKKIIYIPHQNPYKPLSNAEVNLIQKILLG